jgi:hypothetical protein
MNVKQRWAWFLLAALSAAGVGWTHRYEYAACDTDGCVEINRWTGSVDFREIDWDDEPAPDRQMVAVGPGRVASPSASSASR